VRNCTTAWAIAMAFSAISAMAAEGIDLGEEVVWRVGSPEPPKVTATTTAESVGWFVYPIGSRQWDVPLFRADGKSIYLLTLREGKYGVIAWKGIGPGDIAKTTVTVLPEGDNPQFPPETGNGDGPPGDQSPDLGDRNKIKALLVSVWEKSQLPREERRSDAQTLAVFYAAIAETLERDSQRKGADGVSAPQYRTVKDLTDLIRVQQATMFGETTLSPVSRKYPAWSAAISPLFAAALSGNGQPENERVLTDSNRADVVALFRLWAESLSESVRAAR
jgi:hypothetical protein